MTSDLFSLGVEPGPSNTITNWVKEIQGGIVLLKLVQELKSLISLVYTLINHVKRQEQRHEDETRKFRMINQQLVKEQLRD